MEAHFKNNLLVYGIKLYRDSSNHSKKKQQYRITQAIILSLGNDLLPLQYCKTIFLPQQDVQRIAHGLCTGQRSSSDCKEVQI